MPVAKRKKKVAGDDDVGLNSRPDDDEQQQKGRRIIQLKKDSLAKHRIIEKNRFNKDCAALAAMTTNLNDEVSKKLVDAHKQYVEAEMTINDAITHELQRLADVYAVLSQSIEYCREAAEETALAKLFESGQVQPAQKLLEDIVQLHSTTIERARHQAELE